MRASGPLRGFSAAMRSIVGRMGLAGFAGLALSSVVGLMAFAAPALPLDPSGYWSTKDDESIVRLGPCTPGGQVYCGTLVWLKEPLENGVPKIDNLNPDPAKRGQPIIGMELFTEFVAEDDHWKGKAYNADDGRTWEVTFKVRPDKTNGDKGEITGCVLRILCQSETFTKVPTVPGGDPTLATTAAPHGAPAKAPPRSH